MLLELCDYSVQGMEAGDCACKPTGDIPPEPRAEGYGGVE